MTAAICASYHRAQGGPSRRHRKRESLLSKSNAQRLSLSDTTPSPYAVNPPPTKY